MSKISFAVILLIVSTNVMCKDYWQCDAQNKYTCTQQQTCCRLKILDKDQRPVWGCFPGMNAVCCSDGASACPFNTICNLRAMTCDNKPTAFLQVLPSEPILASSTSVNSAEEFAKGFLQGFSFFYNLPHSDSCNPVDPQAVSDIKELVEILKSLSLNSDFTQIIPTILAKLTDAFTKISTISEDCAEYAKEIKTVIEGLREYAQGFSYYTQLAFHTTSNIGTIVGMLHDANVAFNTDKFLDAGRGYGELLKYVLFWNYTPKQVLVFLAEISTIQPSDAVAFAKGFNAGFGFFKNLPHADVCTPDDPTVVQDIVDIVDIIKSTSVTNFTKIIPEIIVKATDAYQRIAAISADCNLYAQEIKTVIDAMEVYVKKTSYKASLMLHLLSNIGTISSKATTGISDFKNKQFNQAGSDFGDLIRFALLWDFKA